MKIKGGDSISSIAYSSFENRLKTQTEADSQEGETPSKNDALAAQAGDSFTPSRSSNLLDGNFFNASRGPSRYVNSLLDNFQVDKSLSNSLNGLVGSLSTLGEGIAAQIGGDSGQYIAATIIAAKSEKAVKQIAEEYISEDQYDAYQQEQDELKKDATDAAGSTHAEDNVTGSDADADPTTMIQEAAAGDDVTPENAPQEAPATGASVDVETGGQARTVAARNPVDIIV